MLRAAIETLIQLKETVPAEKVDSLFKRLPDETLVLLSVVPDKNQEALLFLAKQVKGGVCWTMINNLLAEIDAPGFAAILLKELKTEVYIDISDDGHVSSGGSLGGASVACGGGLRIPYTFPPIAFYELTKYPVCEAIVASLGKYPTYYIKTVSRSGVPVDVRPSNGNESGDEDRKRFSYLAHILKTSEEEIGLKPVRYLSIAWKGNRHYLEEVSSLRQQIKGLYNNLLTSLISSGKLTRDEANSLPLNISFVVNDHRVNKTRRLPQISQN